MAPAIRIGPIASWNRIHAAIAAVSGWISRLTDDSDAGRCANAYAITVCPPICATSDSASSGNQPAAAAGQNAPGDNSANGSSATAVTVVLHAIRRAVE